MPALERGCDLGPHLPGVALLHIAYGARGYALAVWRLGAVEREAFTQHGERRVVSVDRRGDAADKADVPLPLDLFPSAPLLGVMAVVHLAELREDFLPLVPVHRQD